ncbi:bidirectional sugar transporter SWEET7b-like [Papaver somniferum]|uniref:bidirectional sugar transporter SWEET7b-like n=1 Tax=Papaver somniferum TaxID=3469 RepID=UPI000E7010E4|nr:bidirectional sugar transporter SWEET7b-like [Papaver somniferum]
MNFTSYIIYPVMLVGNLFSLRSHVASAPQFYEIIKKRTVKDFSLNPYLTSIFSCGIRFLYSLPFLPYSILAFSIVALVMQSMYIMVYLLYADKEERRYVLDALAVETAVYSVLVGSFTFFFGRATMHKGLVVPIHSTIVNISMQNVMPLDDMMSNIKTMSVEKLPVYLLLANFVNSGIWFALLGFNHFMVVTSGLASVLALIQLILHKMYYNSKLARNVDGSLADGNTLQVDIKDRKQQGKSRSRTRIDS